MNINEQNAKDLFKKTYKSDNGKDFTGREIHLSKYGNSNSPYGWNIDHILPLSKHGTDDEVNLQCTNIKTNETKAEKTTWKDCEKTWQICKIKGNRRAHKVVEINQKE